MSASSMGINQDTVHIMEQRHQMGKSWPQKDQHKTPLPGTNPLERYGRRSKCAVCQSTFHWAKDCLNKSEQVKLTEDINADEVEECNITILCKQKSPTEAEIFMTVFWFSNSRHFLHSDSVWTRMAGWLHHWTEPERDE